MLWNNVRDVKRTHLLLLILVLERYYFDWFLLVQVVQRSLTNWFFLVLVMKCVYFICFFWFELIKKIIPFVHPGFYLFLLWKAIYFLLSRVVKRSNFDWLLLIWIVETVLIPFVFYCSCYGTKLFRFVLSGSCYLSRSFWWAPLSLCCGTKLFRLIPSGSSCGMKLILLVPSGSHYGTWLFRLVSFYLRRETKKILLVLSSSCYKTPNLQNFRKRMIFRCTVFPIFDFRIPKDCLFSWLNCCCH